MSNKKNKKNKGFVFKAKKKDKGTCHHCGNDNYWRRNHKEYLTICQGKKTYEVEDMVS